MKHLAEKDIERYILNSSRSASEAASVSIHLSKCTECYAVYCELKSFYEELNQSSSPAKQDLDRFMSRLYPRPYTITLSQSDESGRATGEFVLAAKSQSSSGGPERFERVANFGSVDYKTIVRVLYDHDRNTLMFYVIREEYIEELPFYILHLPGLKNDLITDKNGKAELQTAPDNISNVNSHPLQVLTAIDRFEFFSSECRHSNESTSAQCFKLISDMNEESLRLQISPLQESIPLPSRMLIEPPNGKPVLIYLEKGIVHIKTSWIPTDKVFLAFFE